MNKRPKSLNRFQAREAEKKIMPAIKLLSQYMHNTAPDSPQDIHYGYVVPAGDFKDVHGVPCQLQVSVVRGRGKFIKENEIKPIINKWAIGFKLKLFTKILVDKIFDYAKIEK